MQVEEITIEGQQSNETGLFPLVLQPLSSSSSLQDTLNFIQSQKSQLEQKLIQHGAILFRNFPIKTVEDFYKFLLSFQWEFGSYLGGGGPRNTVLGPIETSTESPPELKINFHHELAYLTTPPSKLFFFGVKYPLKLTVKHLFYIPIEFIMKF